eukprot:CAMPEP_0169136716 /NCGR_PEP_ID=MMETSP1015-20121227/41107_1 /TAXON_ID=342587 /ORGANISM="Karlodinium micrum, Strain CCMP2283" /LENGTH=48 /DNA_ID= /DNA_START= /DNA_END= /DNA_ORIENTATION=
MTHDKETVQSIPHGRMSQSAMLIFRKGCEERHQGRLQKRKAVRSATFA